MSFPDKFKKPSRFTTQQEKASIAPHLGRDPRLGKPHLKTQLTINGVPQEPVVNETVFQEGFEVHDTNLAATVRGNGIVAGLAGKRRVQLHDGLGNEVVISHEPNK